MIGKASRNASLDSTGIPPIHLSCRAVVVVVFVVAQVVEEESRTPGLLRINLFEDGGCLGGCVWNIHRRACRLRFRIELLIFCRNILICLVVFGEVSRSSFLNGFLSSKSNASCCVMLSFWIVLYKSSIVSSDKKSTEQLSSSCWLWDDGLCFLWKWKFS